MHESNLNIPLSTKAKTANLLFDVVGVEDEEAVQAADRRAQRAELRRQRRGRATAFVELLLFSVSR